MNYYRSFSWALPKAFKDSIALCCFEEGDVLYDTPKAYEGTWADALRYLNFSIQVQYPPRGAKPKVEKDADTIFSDNWKRPVQLDLWEYPSKTKKSLSTTQGRLYTALWKGDLKVLNLGVPEPPVPIFPRDILKKLPSTEPAVLQKYSQNLKHPVIFLMPFDETRDLFREKRQNIEIRLRHDFSYQLHLVAPQDLGISQDRDYIPTLEVACFVLDTSESVRVYECLKSALYVPSKERETNIDRFRLETHGCLCPKNG